MSSDAPAILVIDDDPDIVKTARLLLGRAGMAVTGAADPEAAWLALAATRFDAVLLDLNFARGRVTGAEGLALLGRLTAAFPELAVVVVTGHSGINIAVTAMRDGAADFVVKPWNNDRLRVTTEKAVAITRARRTAGAGTPEADMPLLLGESAAIAAVRAMVARIAPTRAGVLVTGAAGTGKSLVARLVAGADAIELSAGAADALPALPDGATLLVEQVDALAPALHAALARAGRDIRVIATSRFDPPTLTTLLPADMRARFDAIELALPRLEDRGDDALLLARHWLARFATRHGRPPRPLADAAAAAIRTRVWPEGLHELRRACERAVLIDDGDAHGADHFAAAPDEAATPDLNLARRERAVVEEALRRHGFNVSRAAAELGLTRTALYRRIEKHGL